MGEGAYEKALARLHAEFPNGQPFPDVPTFDLRGDELGLRIRYICLNSEVSRLYFELPRDNDAETEEASERDEDSTPAEPDAAWDAFLGDHTELQKSSSLSF